MQQQEQRLRDQLGRLDPALAALEAGVHGLRLNPGNLRKAAEIKEVASEAKDRGVPIRIGVNGGSLIR